jgi:hypothetical protein
MDTRFEDERAHGGRPDEETWLLGQPLLREYLDFMKHAAVNGAEESPAALVDEWRRANDYYHELEQRESGIADTATFHDLDPALGPLVEEVKVNPSFRRAFNKLPTSFGMVELDKLVVYQKSITQTFVQELAARLGPSPTPEELFRFAQPLTKSNAHVEAQKAGSRRYIFRSDSTDFRFQEPVLLAPEQVRGYDAIGPMAFVVALAVGFGSNLLNVIHVGKRFLLHHGYHRAAALRSLGITHAPCVVQAVTRGDELDIAAKSEVAENPAFYFKTARPPLLKDFFDPQIRKIVPTKKQVRMIEVNFEIREHYVSE